MNRITAAVDRMEQRIAERLAAKAVTPERLAILSKANDLEFDEYCRFQELKSLAHIEGRLSQDEAMTVYGYLGHTPEQFNRQSVAVKCVMTMVFAEILNKVGNTKVVA